MRFEGTAVAGVGQVRFGMHRDVPATELAHDAGLSALHDAGVTLADVDEVFVGYLGLQHQVGVRAVKELGLTGLPVTHIENASATGLFAFREAAWAVSSGRAEVAMALTFDKMTDVTGRGSGAGGASRGAGRDQLDASILPAAFFALWAQRRMYDRGTRPETFAAIAAKNWNHGALNPLSHRQPDHAVTVEEVMASRMVAEPLTAMMCCPADDGAAAIVVAGEEWVRLHRPDRRVVRCLSSAAQSEAYSPGHAFLGPVVGPSTMTQTTGQEAYDDAGVGPDDVSLALCHDAFANEELKISSCSGLRARRGRQARRRRRDRAGRAHPVQHRRGPHRPRPSRRSHRGGDGPRDHAAAAARGRGPPGRGGPNRAGPLRRRRQCLHGQHLRGGRLT